MKQHAHIHTHFLLYICSIYARFFF